MSNIKVGDNVTILRWKVRTTDRSWVGDIFEVAAIDKPFYLLKIKHGCLSTGALVVCTDDADLKVLSDEFVNSVMGKDADAERELERCAE